MPGGYAGGQPYYGGTQYPVTPYPQAGAPNYAASGGGASNGYMPPNDPYAAAANPYAGAQPASSYAPAANPYPQPQSPPYSTAGQYGATPYPGGPNGGDTSYTR
jgi:hypothetical protein